jgi:hypothetical protein
MDHLQRRLDHIGRVRRRQRPETLEDRIWKLFTVVCFGLAFGGVSLFEPETVLMMEKVFFGGAFLLMVGLVLRERFRTQA